MKIITPVDPTATISWSTLHVSGVDAVSYLQGQLTADVVARGERGLVLQPDSTVVAPLWLHYVEDSVLITCVSELAPAVVTRLRRFILRSNVVIEEVGVAGVPFSTEGERIDAREPGPYEIQADALPFVFGSSFVQANVSFTKGCFTGQELVGRMDARGASAPMQLAYFKAATLGEVAEALRDATPRSLLEKVAITSAVQRTGYVDGLALVHRSIGGSANVVFELVQ